MNSAWRSSQTWILLVCKKTTLKNLHTLVFCLMFLVILFDSHIFLLGCAHQTRIILSCMLLCQKLCKQNHKGPIKVLIFRVPLVYPQLVFGTSVVIGYRSCICSNFFPFFFFSSYFRYTVVAGWSTSKSAVFNQALCWKRRGRR